MSTRRQCLSILVALSISLTACGDAPSQERSWQIDNSEVSTSVPRPLMPDVVCLDLQTAQDLIQDQGVFFSRSNDASGQSRSQIIDRNWVVVSQNLPPGSPIGEGEVVLDVLKISEATEEGLC